MEFSISHLTSEDICDDSVVFFTNYGFEIALSQVV